MNDIDFIKQVNIDLGDSYYIARSLSLQHPTHSLTELRNSLEILCSMTAEKASVKFIRSDDLFTRINKLFDHKVIDIEIKDQFHSLRTNTNKGAHSSDHKNLTNDNWIELSSVSLKSFCKLVELIAYNIYGLDLEAYEYINTEDIHFTLANLCEEALFDHNIHALYSVGKILLIEIQEQYKDYEGDSSYSGLEKNKPNLLAKLRQAYLYMDLAKENPLAEFEVAQLEWDGIVCKQDRNSSLTIYKRLADEGLAEASYTYGHLFFHEEIRKQHNLSKDECLHYLKISADQGHLEAGNLVGKHFIYTCNDVESGYKYFKLSAERGHSNSLYSIGLMYLKQAGDEISILAADKELDKKGLQKASLIYFKEAFKLENVFAGIKLATLYIIMKVDIEQGFKLFEECLLRIRREKDYQNYFIEKYELGKLYCEVFDSRGLHYIYECFNHAQEFELKEIIISESSKIIPKTMLDIQNYNEQQLRFICEISMLFHPSGIPMTTEEHEQYLNKMTLDKRYRKKVVQNALPRAQPPVLKSTSDKVGRNDSCPCGSGKKYKKCCA